MRRYSFIAIFSLTVVALGAVIYVTQPFNSDRRVVMELATSFMEDVQFKDFRSSALYHHELEQDRVDIGKAIERLFQVRPEMLDIMDFRIARTEVDSTARRARVLVNSRVKRLNVDDDPREVELHLFFIRRHPQCPLGADCQGGQCHDERGLVTRDAQEGDDDGAPEPYACDDALEHRWFMNLDSTLERRDYRR